MQIVAAPFREVSTIASQEKSCGLSRFFSRRQRPLRRHRLAELSANVQAGASKKLGLTHRGIDPEKQRQMDALRKPVPFKSKIDQTKIGRS